ncbi:MAG: phosphoribosyltransferase family protein [Christiangramia sp.]|uniref:ComF family protein n=1 Tax=Christiangramia sp. TaxID=1931228 RepID=UPI0032423D41
MFHDFLNLLYPRLCYICGTDLLKNEQVVCTSCLHDLPVTNYHLDNDNPVKKVFYGRVPVVDATALLHFRKKAAVQQLIHELKYRGKKEIGVFFGRWLGAELSESEKFTGVDLVIPVPLHPSKLKERGYNQVTRFGQEIAHSLNAEFSEEILIKTTATKTQTLKDRISRWGKIEETLRLQQPHKAEGKHILLVDDLVTTGATLEACAHKLLEIPKTSISIATMAITD